MSVASTSPERVERFIEEGSLGPLAVSTSRLCSAPAILISGSVAMTAKETARAVLDRLPEDCSLDDVLYHLYVAQTVQQGGPMPMPV